MKRIYQAVWRKISQPFSGAAASVLTPTSSQPLAGSARESQRVLSHCAPGLMRLEPRLVFDGAAVETFTSAQVDTAPELSSAAQSVLPVDAQTLSAGALSQAQLDRMTDVNRDGLRQLVSAQGEPREVVIIDSRVPGLAELLSDTREGVDVWLLDAGSSAIEQISSILSGYQSLDALHLVSHGSEGAVHLGAQTLSLATLGTQADTLAAWGSALNAEGDILLYGCDIAAGETGMAFLSQFAAATGADVAASSNRTGASWLGGDWVLEVNHGVVEQTASVTPQFANYDGLLAPINGTPGNDTLTGTVGDDTIYGGDGNDTISALEGNDLLYGENGNDTIYGGDGIDTLYGGAGNDFLYGETGADYLYGGDGNDGMSGGDGNDTLYGGAGNDTVVGSTGDDLLYGGDGNDWIWGQKDNDILWGEGGDDTLSGDAGNDTLYGGAGNDTLSGGSDADFLYGGDGNDVLSGMQGVDVLFGGAGDDTFAGSDSHLNGDTIGDLAVGDVIRINGITGLTTANVRFNGAGILEIDTNGTDFSTVEVTLTLSNAAGNSLQVDTVSDSAGSTLITFKTLSVPTSTSTPAPVVEVIPPPVWPADTYGTSSLLAPTAYEPPAPTLGLGAHALHSTPENLGLGGQVRGGTTNGSPLSAMLGSSGAGNGSGVLSTLNGLGPLLSMNGLGSPGGFADALDDRLGGGLTGGLGGALGGNGVLGEPGAAETSDSVPGAGANGQSTTQPPAEGDNGEPPAEASAGDAAALHDDVAAAVLAGAPTEVAVDAAAGKLALSEQLRQNGAFGRQAERDALLAHARAVAAAKAPHSG